MIETTRAGLQQAFFARADQFVSEPTVMNGIELDDATIALKRKLMSEQATHPAIGALNELAGLIRRKDVDGMRQRLDALRKEFD